jgi:hypothetical protein
MSPLSAPSGSKAPLQPPPPRGKAIVKCGPGGANAGTNSRYAVPDFAFGETPERVQARGAQQEQENESSALMPPPPSTNATAPPTTARTAPPLPAAEMPPTVHSSPVIHSTVQHFSGGPNIPAAAADAHLPSSTPPPAPPSTNTGAPPPPLQPPPPAMTPPSLPSTASAAAPPLTTRVSGAALRNAVSSRASSNGGGSRASSNHSQGGRRGSLGTAEEKQQQQPQPQPQPQGPTAAVQKTTSSLFVFPPPRVELDRAQTVEIAAATATARPTPAGYSTHTGASAVGSRPGSRSGSLNAHPVSAAAIAAGSRASFAAVRNSPNNAAAASIHHDVPSFLKPAGGGGAAAAAANLHAPSSRGRELLEAALKSRGHRTANLRGGEAAASAATTTAESSGATSLQEIMRSEASSGSAASGRGVTKQPSTIASYGVSVHDKEDVKSSSEGARLLDSGEEPEVGGGADEQSRTFTGDFSTASPSSQAPGADDRLSPALSRPLPQHGQPATADTKSTFAAAAAGPRHGGQVNKDGVVTGYGAMASATATVCEVGGFTKDEVDASHRHTPDGCDVEPLSKPTVAVSSPPTDVSSALPPQRNESALLQTAALPLTRNAGAVIACNPFLESGADESEQAADTDVPVVVNPQPLPVQPPPLPHHAHYTGVSVTLTPPLMTPIGEATPSTAFNPFADAVKAGADRAALPLAPPPLPKQQQPPQQQQHSQLPQPGAAAPPLQPPPLPPLPQQRVAGSTGTATAPSSNDYNTPRNGDGGGSTHDYHQKQQRGSQPTTGLPPPPTAAGSATRGPYAASPYTREGEGTRTADDESPLPLRPPSFDSVGQPDTDETQEPEREVPAPAREEEEEGFGEHSVQQGKHEDDDDAVASNAVRPFTWGNTGSGVGEEDGTAGDCDDNVPGSAQDIQSTGARRQTQRPDEMAALAAAAPAALSHPLPLNASSPPPPPPTSSSAPVNHNHGAANPFVSRRPDAHANRADDLRRQYQEQLQSRVQAAQQSAAGAATLRRGHRRSSPTGEDATKHFSEGIPQTSTAFSDSRSGSSNNFAQASPRSAPPHPQQAPLQHNTDLNGSLSFELKEHAGASRPSFTSASNPFLDPDDDGLFGQSNRSTAAPESNAALAGAAHLLKPQHGATSSVGSLPPQQMSPSTFSASLEQLNGNHIPKPNGGSYQPLSSTSSVNGAPALSLTEDEFCATGNYSNLLSASGVSGGAASRTPGGSALVNPFSKAARSSAANAFADFGSNAAGGGQSPGASLTSSFAARRKPRRLAAPCFAIFVGGATTGVPLGSEMTRGVSCIAACFNNPRAASPSVGGGLPNSNSNNNNNGAAQNRSPSSQAGPGGSHVSHASSLRSPPPNGSSRAGAATVSPRPDANNNSNSNGNSSNGNGSGIYLSFCGVTEALTAKGSVVDRKGIRGTESGRRYVRALRDAVLPCALAASAPKWSELAEAMKALETCVPAPLASVLMIIVKDAMEAETQEGFVWKESGGRRLGELLLQASQAEARRYATTASSGQGNAALVNALSASPLNTTTDGGGVSIDTKEKSAALTKVEDLLCTGQRIEAVEVALEARLYVHALLISMMCPTKDEYLRSVQAVMQKEVLLYSPLAHAYSMFNELPLPPLLPPPPPPQPTLSKNSHEGEQDGKGARDAELAGHDERRMREVALRDQATLKGTWRRHAAVLLANFTRHSGEGLLSLAGKLQQLHLVVEAHTCLLLLHLTPLGMASPVRAGAEPLPPVSDMSAEEVEEVLPRADQRQVMDEIRRRLCVVGGMYHPTQGCRAGFLTPITTLLTQLLRLVQEQLNARAPPLQVPGVAGPPVPFHGLPGYPPRTDVGYRMMQVLWLREVGLVRESRQALAALLQRMPPPAAFSLCAPPRTINELVYLFGAVPPPAGGTRPPPPDSLTAESTTMLPDNNTPENISGTQHPSTTTSTAVATHFEDEQPADGSDGAKRVGRGVSGSLPISPDDRQSGPLPPPPASHPQQQSQSESQQQQTKSLAATALTPGQRAAALQPPARPPQPPSKQQQQESPQQQATASPASPTKASSGADSGSNPTPKLAAAAGSSRRSRSMEALRNFFFRRGKSESKDGEKTTAAEEAKPMHLDTEKTPEFDPVTGRWLFPETEEEKKLRELTKQGPPKMAPKAAEPASTASATPEGTSSPHAPSTAGRQPYSAPPSASAAAPGGGPVAGGVKRPPGPSSGLPAPTHGVAVPTFAPGRGAPPPMMAGRGGGVRRPGGRQQYVDMFNSTN